MSLYQTQKLLFNLHNDFSLRAKYKSDPQTVLTEYKVTDGEARALLEKDIRALYRMGVNPWLLLQYAHIMDVSTPDYLKQIRGEQS